MVDYYILPPFDQSCDRQLYQAKRYDISLHHNKYMSLKWVQESLRTGLRK